MLAERTSPTSTSTEFEYEQILYRLTSAVAAAQSLDEIYEAAMSALRDSLGVERSAVLLADADGVLRFRAWRGLSESYRGLVEGHSPWDVADPDPQPVLVPDAALDPSLTELRTALEMERIGGLAFIPLVVGKRLLGKFMLYYAEPHEFSERELVVARTMATQVAFGIDQHRSRMNLLSEQMHMRAMLRSSVTGVAEIDPNGCYVMANDRFCEMVGWSRDELLGGRTCPSITHPDDRERTTDAIGSLLNGGEHSTIEKRYVRPDGGVVWALSSFSAIRDEHGQLVGALVIITDINEAKLVTESIRASEERYRGLIEALGLAVYTTDARGVINLYNDAAATLWGRRPVLGEDKWCGSWRIFTPEGEPLELDDCPMAVTLKTGEPVRDEEILVERPDGSRANVLPYPSPLRDANGCLIGAVNVLVDVTELKATQLALQEAIRAKDDFLGQVSHELRTPVTQIGGNAEVLRRRWDQLSSELQQASLEEIYTQTKRMQRLIDNMMVLSRIERGLLPDLEPQLVQRLVHETVTQFRDRFPATEVQVRVDRDLPPVETSAATIDQVVYNLLTNAQKYGPPNGPIELEASEHDGWVEVRVLDSGPGVSERDMDRIFEPYFRSASSPEHASGIGLGLSVCKRLMEAQGGELWARRREPCGMEFGARLPILDDVGHD